MFDIGFLELLIVSIVGLLVLGPERLPGAIRTVMAYVNKIRRSFAGIRAEIERELQADEFRQDLHNQGIMEELKQAEKALRSGLSADDVKLGKDGYPVDEPYAAPEPAAQEEPSAHKEPSAQGEPSGHADAAEEPSGHADAAEEPSGHADAAEEQPPAEQAAAPVAETPSDPIEPEDETRAAKP